ncbi:MAG: hypothetical protein HIU88_14165 [Acidobacteria bacterium]|nr:hypothetical protein [Acidobacteriota bacterium]
MTEHELHGMWATARWHIIASQLAPTLLLAASVGFVMAGIGHMPTPIRLALALILLAGGILGFAAQYSSAAEAKAIAADLAAIDTASQVTARIIANAKRTSIVTATGPTIFVLIYLALLWAIFAPPSAGGMQ